VAIQNVLLVVERVVLLELHKSFQEVFKFVDAALVVVVIALLLVKFKIKHIVFCEKILTTIH
jgi:hypothetical protein